MPLPTDKLTKQSSMEAIRQAIADTISMLVDEGRDQEQAVAMALDSARRHSGQALGQQRLRNKSARESW